MSIFMILFLLCLIYLVRLDSITYIVSLCSLPTKCKKAKSLQEYLKSNHFL